MAEHKSQHFLPACYLYGFTNAEQRKAHSEKRETRVWSYDIHATKLSERPIRKVATRPYLYSFRHTTSGNREHAIELMLEAVS